MEDEDNNNTPANGGANPTKDEVPATVADSSNVATTVKAEPEPAAAPAPVETVKIEKAETEENGVSDVNDKEAGTGSDESKKAEENGANAASTTATAAISERKAWDFSHRRVMVKNIMKFMNKRDIKKMLASWTAGTDNKIQINKTKKPPKDPWIVVTVEQEDQVAILVDYINTNNLTNKRGDKLFAHSLEPQQGVREGDDDDDRDNENGDGNNRKRGGDRDDDKGGSKRQRVQRALENAKPRIITNEELKNAMLPLWKNTYEEQLRKKEKEMIKRSALRIVKEIKDKFRQMEREAKRNKARKSVKPYPWLLQQRAIEIAPIVRAKDIVRNKCEFTFGYRYMADDKPQESAAGTLPPTVPPADSDGRKDSEMKDAETPTAPETEAVEISYKKEMDEQGATKMLIIENNRTGPNDPPKEKDEVDIPIKKIPSVGAMAKGWSGGVSLPVGCRNIPSEAMSLIEIVESFLADCPMPPYNPREHKGFWRTLTIRSSRRTRECMLIFVHAPLTGGAGSKDDENVDNYTPEVFVREKERLLSMVTGKKFPTTYPKLEEEADGDANKSGQDEKDTIEVTSVFFQEFGGVSMPLPDHPVQHIFGAKSIKEKLGQCTFQISPGAFFQVNTETAETLYNIVVEKVKEVSPNPEETLCFDVCCGTGTIGLTLMKEGAVGKVVGIDIAAPAIEDAKINAELNGFGSDDSKTRFVAARAEHVMMEELKNARKAGKLNGKVVAVVDPAREGLHSDVVRALRGFSQIDRLIYVSCNPTGSLLSDSALLCTPASKRYKGRAFKPSLAQPVDMFPYSDHCEMVMVLDRLTDEELGGQPE